MARIGEIVTGRPVDVVFDNVADQRNEPRYNLRMMRAAGTATAAHGTWLPGSREAPQCGAAGAGASHEVIRFGYERSRSRWAAGARAGRRDLLGSGGARRLCQSLPGL